MVAKILRLFNAVPTLAKGFRLGLNFFIDSVRRDKIKSHVCFDNEQFTKPAKMFKIKNKSKHLKPFP